MPHENPQTTGVVGAGTMGAGIAQGCVVAGLSVVMIDVDDERIARARNAIPDGIERMLRKAAPPAGDRGAALDRLRGTTDYEALRSGGFIIEAPKSGLHSRREPATYRRFAAHTCHGAQS